MTIINLKRIIISMYITKCSKKYTIFTETKSKASTQKQYGNGGDYDFSEPLTEKEWAAASTNCVIKGLLLYDCQAAT